MVEVKKAVPRSHQNQYLHEQNRGQNSYFRTNGSNSNDMNIRTKKIFVGGLSANLTEDDFKFYFEKFGRVIHRCRGYARQCHPPTTRVRIHHFRNRGFGRRCHAKEFP